MDDLGTNIGLGIGLSILFCCILCCSRYHFSHRNQVHPFPCGEQNV